VEYIEHAEKLKACIQKQKEGLFETCFNLL